MGQRNLEQGVENDVNGTENPGTRGVENDVNGTEKFGTRGGE